MYLLQPDREGHAQANRFLDPLTQRRDFNIHTETVYGCPMKLSAKCRCGIRMLTDLAVYYGRGPAQVGDISRRQNISVKYLEQIIRPLKRADLVRSTRGPKGGHALAKRPDKVTVGQVARALDRQDATDECFCNEEKCSSSDTCRLRHAWQEASNVFWKELDRTTISDLVGECCI